MNKKYIINKNEEIASIVKHSKKIYNEVFNIHYNKNNEGYDRFCISVSKKIGNAVIRNRCRRIIKDILSKKDSNLGFNYVIIIKKPFLDLNYISIKSSLQTIMEEICKKTK